MNILTRSISLGYLLVAGALSLGPSAFAQKDAGAQIPLSKPPQALVDANGNVELDLVDPFQSGTPATKAKEELPGFSDTALGNVSKDFRILAIAIPDDDTKKPMAIIQLDDDSGPTMVREGELVQIRRQDSDETKRQRQSPRNNSETASALESFTFYLHIKTIHPRFIEAYRKKRPNETIILGW